MEIKFVTYVKIIVYLSFKILNGINGVFIYLVTTGLISLPNSISLNLATLPPPFEPCDNPVLTLKLVDLTVWKKLRVKLGQAQLSCGLVSAQLRPISLCLSSQFYKEEDYLSGLLCGEKLLQSAKEVSTLFAISGNTILERTTPPIV